MDQALFMGRFQRFGRLLAHPDDFPLRQSSGRGISASVTPEMYSMARKSTPPSVLKSWMAAMLG